MCYSIITVDKDTLIKNFIYNNGILQYQGSLDNVGYVGSNGYLMTRFWGKQTPVHRIIWIMHNGPIPANLQIDHIDRNKLNNRIENLRLVTASGNKQNQDIQSNNTSGHRGISWSKKDNHWFAYITKDRKQYVLGCFKKFEDAVKVRKEAELNFKFLTCQS